MAALSGYDSWEKGYLRIEMYGFVPATPPQGEGDADSQPLPEEAEQDPSSDVKETIQEFEDNKKQWETCSMCGRQLASSGGVSSKEIEDAEDAEGRNGQGRQYQDWELHPNNIRFDRGWR